MSLLVVSINKLMMAVHINYCYFRRKITL